MLKINITVEKPKKVNCLIDIHANFDFAKSKTLNHYYFSNMKIESRKHQYLIPNRLSSCSTQKPSPFLYLPAFNSFIPFTS